MELAHGDAMLNLIRFAGIIFISGSITWACSGTDSTQASNGSGRRERHSSGRRRYRRWRGGSRRHHWGIGRLWLEHRRFRRIEFIGWCCRSSGFERGAGHSGAASVSALGCAKDEDCIVAYGHSNKGCCFRGCGLAYNRDYVAADPCVTANAMTDPVPASCDTGCLRAPWLAVSASLRRSLPRREVHVGDPSSRRRLAFVDAMISQ